MVEKRSTFQMIIFAAFAFFIIAAVLVFAGLSAGKGGRQVGDVSMWGTFDQNMMDTYFKTLKDKYQNKGSITYRQIPSDEFQSKLVEAFANGEGPDLFILKQSNLLNHWNQIIPFSYKGISERQFKNTYIGEAELFMSKNGIRAMPFSIDPMVLYWNRDIFAESGFANPPVFWNQIFLLSERITKLDKANNIKRAAIAFGEFDNVNHAKDIISTLIMQAGGKIIGIDSSGKFYSKISSGAPGGNIKPAQTALRFYTSFANPIKSVYSWNRSMPNSLDAFAQGKLAMYIGYASEAKLIKEKNAHLNFDVAPLPQIKAGTQRKILTFGTMYALAVPRVAKNVYGGIAMARFLSSAGPSRIFSSVIGTPSPRRDILGVVPSDPLDLIFRDAALISTAWLDPNAEQTTKIFRQMVGGITSGAMRISENIQRANKELNILIKRQ